MPQNEPTAQDQPGPRVAAGPGERPDGSQDPNRGIDLRALAREIVALMKEDVRVARERRGPGR